MLASRPDAHDGPHELVTAADAVPLQCHDCGRVGTDMCTCIEWGCTYACCDFGCAPAQEAHRG